MATTVLSQQSPARPRLPSLAFDAPERDNRTITSSANRRAQIGI
jgi:hypothetical protein